MLLIHLVDNGNNSDYKQQLAIDVYGLKGLNTLFYGYSFLYAQLIKPFPT